MKDTNKIIEELVLESFGIGGNDGNIIAALTDKCDDVHASCDSTCPVYALNGNEVPDTAHDFQKNRGCDCFKDGSKMLALIRGKLSVRRAMPTHDEIAEAINKLDAPEGCDSNSYDIGFAAGVLYIFDYIKDKQL